MEKIAFDNFLNCKKYSESNPRGIFDCVSCEKYYKCYAKHIDEVCSHKTKNTNKIRKNIQLIKIHNIILNWSDWYDWYDLKKNENQGGIKIPKDSGVCEVKYKNSEERLTIGKSNNLKKLIRYALINGKKPHSEGKKIRAKENISDLCVRWALVYRCAAVEEDLHLKYLMKYNKYPKYMVEK